MSQILHLEIPDPLFQTIQRQAAAQGSDPATVATNALEDHFQSPLQRDANAAGAFRALFGAADLGHATGLDNEAIDADLTRNYASGLND